jgi:hypothetical protein
MNDGYYRTKNSLSHSLFVCKVDDANIDLKEEGRMRMRTLHYYYYY